MQIPPLPRRGRWLGAIVLATLLLSLPDAPAANQRSPLSDLLQLVVRQREVIALDAETGRQRTADLERGEVVTWHDTRGAVAVVLTDRRLLAVSVRSGAWQSERYRAGEQRPQSAALGDRVALVVTNRRAIGFDGGSGNLVEADLGPREALLTSGVGENVAVAVTTRRALGVSPFVGGFFSVRLRLSERIDDLSTTANLATLVTSHRLLSFRASTGSWEERDLDLR